MVKIKKEKELQNSLEKLLADSYTLYLKTQNFHWNVKGSNFHMYHAMFMVFYTDLSTAVDLLAERLRALGHRAPGSYAEFDKLTSIKENTKDLSAMQMVKELLKDNEMLAKDADRLRKAAEANDDQGTADIAIGRLQIHQKNAWMLKSSLD